MSTEKQISARIQHKHDIEANWVAAGNAAKPFIPKIGEIIVYDIDDSHDYERIKIGDGVTAVTELPFYQEDVAYISTTDNETITDVNTGGANIDVVATVGQTIRVKEVDENGKPTAWEAADYQEKICGAEMALIVPEQEAVYDEGSGFFMAQGNGTLTAEKTYNVTYNGTSYSCECVELQGEGMPVDALGNTDALMGTGDNGMPFAVLDLSDGGMTGLFGVMPFDGAESVTLSIEGKVVIPIPEQYVTNAFPYYIDVTGSGEEDDPYVCNRTVEEVINAAKSGRALIMRTNTPIAVGWYYCLVVFFSGDMAGQAQFVSRGTLVNGVFNFMPQADGTYKINKNIE